MCGTCSYVVSWNYHTESKDVLCYRSEINVFL